MHAPVPPPHGPPPTRSSSTRYTPRHPSAGTSGGAPSTGSSNATLLRLAPSPRPPTLSRPPSSSLPQPSTTMLATQQAQASSLPYAHGMPHPPPPPPPRDDDSPSVHSDAASSSHASSSAAGSTVATSAAMARSKVQNILAQLQMHQDSSNAPSASTSMSSLPRPTHAGTLPRASMIPTAPDRSTPTPSKAIPNASARGASPPRYTRPSLLYGTSPGRAAATVAAQHEPVVAAAAASPSANVLATSPASRRLRTLARQPSMTGLSSGYGLRSAAAATSSTTVSSATGLALPPAVAPAAADGYSSSAAQRAAADLDQLAADLGLTSLDAATTTTSRHPRSTPSTSRPPTRTTHASADPAAATVDPLLAPASSKQAHRLSMAFARLAHSTLSTPPGAALLEAPTEKTVDAATAKNTAANAGNNQSILLLSNDEFAKRLEADWAVPPTPSAAATSFAAAAAGRASTGPPSSPTPTQQHARTAIPPPSSSSRGANANDAQLPPTRRAPPSPSPAVPTKAADRPPSTSRAAHLRLSLGVTHGTTRAEAALASPMRGSFMQDSDARAPHPRTSLIPPPVDVHAANTGTARAKSPRREPMSARLKSPVMPTPPSVAGTTNATRSTLPRASAAAGSTGSAATGTANGSPPGSLLARRRSTRQAPSLSSTGTTSRATGSGTDDGARTGTISRRGITPPDTSASTASPARSSRIPTLAGAAAAAVAATSAFGPTKTTANGGSPARTSTTTTGTSRLTALASSASTAQAPSSTSSSGSTRPTSSGPSARPTSQSASRTRATTPRRTTDSAATGRSTSASTAKTPPPAKRPTSAARSSAPASVSLPFAGKRHTLRAVATAGGSASPWTLAQSGSSGSGGAAVATHRRRKSLTGVPTLAPANATGAVARPNARARTARTNDFRKSMVRRTRDSALSKLTLALVDTYRRVNPAFAYTPRHNPRRVLTKPAKPVRNDGYDNEDNDYILYVNDVLGDDPARSYVIVDLLGQGTFGQVVKCHHVQTQEVSAVKVIKNKPAYFNQSLMEVNVLEVLNKQFDADDTRHIIRLRDSFVYRRHLCLVFEPLSINLYELIKQNQFRGLSLKLVRTFTAQILDALACLADAKLIHADLKPENVLLKSATGTDLKVIDFGSACQEHQTVYTYIQSRFYRSPEVLLGLPYNTAIDMWSTGCIAAELFLGLPLFPGTSEYNQVSRIVDMLGMPPTYMLEVGKNAKTFFQKLADAPNAKYRLKPRDQYARERNTTEQPSKRYFAGTTLRDVVMQYPVSRKLQGADLDHEMNLRECLVDFLLGMLCFNPMERWSAHQAKMHPFITGAPFTGPWSPTAAVAAKTSASTAHRAASARVGSVPATSNSPIATTASPATSAHTVSTPAPVTAAADTADPVPAHQVGGSPTSLRMGRRRAKTISAGVPAPGSAATATAVAGAVDAAALTTQLMHLAVAAGDAPAHARMRRASGIDGAQLAAAAATSPAAVANQPVGRIHVVGAPQQQQQQQQLESRASDLPTWNPAYRMIPSHLGLYSTLSGGADDDFDEVDEFFDDADDEARAASAAARSRRPSHAVRRASVKSGASGMAPAAEADALAMWAAAAAPAIEGGSDVSANGPGVDLEWMQVLLQNAHVRQRTTTGQPSVE
ncbi:dual specificity protein kinase yak1 [Allomyces javanicus]|nr:dual specificity protein kinase yak1 [Allomyces javanicus]